MKHSYFASVLLCGLLQPAFTASAQLPIVDISMEHDADADQLHIFLRANDYDFSELISSLVFTIRWPEVSSATLGLGTPDPWCPLPNTAFSVGPSAPVTPGTGFNYRTYAAVNFSHIGDIQDNGGCGPAGQVLTADEWIMVFTITINNDPGGTVFELSDDQFTEDDNRSYFISLNGEPSTGSIFTFSTAVEAATIDAPALSLLPNPTDGLAQLTLNIPTVADINLELFDPTGRAVMRTTYPAVIGTFRQTFNVKTFSDGVYFLKVQIGEKVSTHRLVVDRD